MLFYKLFDSLNDYKDNTDATVLNPQIFDKEFSEERDKDVKPKEIIRDAIFGTAVLVIVANIFSIYTCVMTLFNWLALELDGVDIDLPVTSTVEFDLHRFLEESQLNAVSSKEILSCDKFYYSYEEFFEQEGIELPQYEGEKLNVYDGLQYMYIKTSVNTEKKYGELVISATLHVNALEKYYYKIRGIFAVDEYTPDSTAVTFEHTKATSVYELADGKRAYFVKNRGFGTQTVYFEANGILYQVEIRDSETEIANVQKLAEIMTEGTVK